MAKMHTYEDEEPCDCNLSDEADMLHRCLESINDLLDETARGQGTKLSIQQENEMDNIIKDARVKGYMNAP